MFHSRITKLTIPVGTGSPDSIYYDSELIFTNNTDIIKQIMKYWNIIPDLIQ